MEQTVRQSPGKEKVHGRHPDDVIKELEDKLIWAVNTVLPRSMPYANHSELRKWAKTAAWEHFEEYVQK